MTHTVIKYLLLLLLALPAPLAAQKVIIPMDKSQTDHLKAYGIAYWCLERNGFRLGDVAGF
jgi:hypothetical protein